MRSMEELGLGLGVVTRDRAIVKVGVRSHVDLNLNYRSSYQHHTIKLGSEP